MSFRPTYPDTVIQPSHPAKWKKALSYGAVRTKHLTFNWEAEQHYEKEVVLPCRGVFHFWYQVGEQLIDIDDSFPILGIIPDLLVPLKGKPGYYLQHKKVPLTTDEIITYLKLAGFRSL